ncbi:MAG TPA: DedA family protein [Streptosporangiaceae bacterium]|jgi:membrane protein DedA with SNARE-associated domain
MINLSHLAVNSPVSYLIALLLPALDVIIPILPSETAIITLGVATAGSSDPRIAILVALAAAGAFLGDNLAYIIGRRLGPFIDRRFFSGEKGEKRKAWAVQALDHYGARLIIVCRFIPGARTAVTLVCGLVEFRRRTFVIATACAGVIWACYAFFIGRLGGQAFESRPWAGLLLAFGAALAITGLIELVRRLQPWRWFRRAQPDQAEAPPPDGPHAAAPPAPDQAAGPAASPADGQPAPGRTLS